MDKLIKVMLVEDNPEYREVIKLALKFDKNISLDSQFGTAEIALRSLQSMSTRTSPDIILLDLCLPEMCGLEALPYFRKYIPTAEIIILTQSENKADILNAIQLGAKGYFLKSSTIQQIKEGIHTVIGGGASLDGNVANYILSTVKSNAPKAKLKKELSGREMEILTLLGSGMMKKEIGSLLEISYPTVDTHVRHIYEKLDVPNAPAAINKAHEFGLFSKDN